MQIQKVEIKNFRNIENFSFDASKTTAVAGLNHVGKTNTLHAIYWVLADSLLDNSKTFDSITPKNDNRALTSVKLTFDNTMTLEKTYCEKWTKTRGSDIEKLTGHETSYYLNGSPVSTQSEALRTIKTILLGDQSEEVGKYNVDLIKVLTNPLYLFGQEDWKAARQFIMSLVNVKTDAEIFDENPHLQPIQVSLQANMSKTDLLMKNYNNRIKTLNQEVKNSEAVINSLKKIADENKVSESEVAQAKLEKDKYNTALLEIKRGNQNTNLDSLTDTQRKLLTQRDQIEKELREKKQLSELENGQKRKELIHQKEELEAKANQHRADIYNIKESAMKLAQINKQIDFQNAHRQELLDHYKEVKAKEFTFSKIECPHCHHQLNEDEEENARKLFDSHKDAELYTTTLKGKECVAQIAKLTAEKNDLSRANNPDDEIRLEGEINATQAKINALTAEIDSIPYSVNDYDKENDANWKEITAKINQLEKEINAAATRSISNIQENLTNYQRDNISIYTHFSEIEKKKIIFENTLEKLHQEEDKYKSENIELAEVERCKLLLKEFIIVKLKEINDSTKLIFPDIEFTLVEQNITEGSFTEVCYPLIKGKKTPFANGSNSERILTGIAILEDIKKFMNLPAIPIIFDEGETLDIFSISQIQTESQVFYSVVDSAVAGDAPVIKNY